MILAGHHTMLGGSAALRSVEFSGNNGSNLFYKRTQNMASNFSISFWGKALEDPTFGAFVKYGFGGPAETGFTGGGWGIGFGSERFETGYTGSNFVYLYEVYAWKHRTFSQSKTDWHHYAVSRNGSSFAYYLDGSLFFTDTQSGFATGSDCVFIGGYSGSSAHRFLPCRMTRVALWTRNLSASEVAMDYADGNAAPSATNGLEHFWPLSSAGNFLSDLVGDAVLTIGSAGVALSPDVPKLSTGGVGGG